VKIRNVEFKKTLIKKGSTIGANATILCGIQVGSYAMIGAGAVVLNNVPEFALIVGNPARQTGWVSIDGNKLDFDETGHATCPATGKKYKLENDLVKPMFSY